ncbi:hypothetical protein FRB95_006360 [Tulasnella sp. JGI-2019a]|nr:hypothetical protein FRB95_006360 [Tulasnella sp. JGI-2019a]
MSSAEDLELSSAPSKFFEVGTSSPSKLRPDQHYQYMDVTWKSMVPGLQSGEPSNMYTHLSLFSIIFGHAAAAPFPHID